MVARAQTRLGAMVVLGQACDSGSALRMSLCKAVKMFQFLLLFVHSGFRSAVNLGPYGSSYTTVCRSTLKFWGSALLSTPGEW